MNKLLILIFILTVGCSATQNKEIKEHRFIVSITKQLISPGFGFGKTLNHNYEILNNLELFKILNRPILVGISRKSMIYKVLNNTPQSALTGTISLNTIALVMGANLLRVHDVKEAKETINLFNYLKENV